MPLFIYKAADGAGKTVTDRIDRNSKAEVAEFIRSRGLYPLTIRKGSPLNMDLSDLLKKPVSLKTLSLFCRQLSFFLESGMLLPRAFQIIQSQTKDKRVKRMLMDIREHSLRGNSLSDCLKTAPVPPLAPALCRVGEESGKLAEAVGQLADYYEREFKNRQSLTGALIYPVILTVMMLAVTVLAIVYVIPNYAAIFESVGIPLPLPTRILMSAGDFILRYGLFVITALLAAGLCISGLLRTKRGKTVTGFIRLHTPLWRAGMNLRFCKCMSMLLNAGLPAPESLSITRDAIANAYLDRTFISIVTGLKQGRKFSTLLAEARYFDPMLINMTEIGEETGDLARPISQCAAFYQTEQERTSALYAKLAEPVIMIFLGSALALIMLSVILPTFELVNAF